MSSYFGHSIKGSQGTAGWQLLRDHLRGVAALAKRFATESRPGDAVFGAGAESAGLLHDVGKYRSEFQEMLHGRPKGESTRHKQAGAAWAMDRKWHDLAFVIAGHHGGIPDKQQLKELVAATGGRDVANRVEAVAKADCSELASIPSLRPIPTDPLLFDLHVRLLFSCLVDADWLDTAEHACAALDLPALPAPADLNPGERLRAVLDYISRRSADCANREIAQIRSDVLNASLTAAEQPPGIFSMAVPTGGGKTLSALAFALKHAVSNGFRKIIYVAPYLSIIEQNAQVFRGALGARPDDGVVLEHHSLADPGDDSEQSSRAQLLAENWEAPVIVTTSVQFYESLFSNKPGRCRKVHNIARSVVILDECQALPPDLTRPTVQMLQSVVSGLHCTIVLCTATQPAWNADANLLPEGITHVRHIVPAELKLSDRLRRVRVTWPKVDERWGWGTLADRLAAESQVLCVVNTKNAAREIFRALQSRGSPNSHHLSTAMCPAHRLEVLARIRHLLKTGQPCRLISTQLIEAGVDVDFPVVLRELAPLDGIIQAAGRCNREGLLNDGDGSPGGNVIVFRSEEDRSPDGWYKAGKAILEQDFLAVGREPDIGNPADLQEYLRRLFHRGDLDERRIVQKRRDLSFRTVAESYRLVDDAATISVVAARWKPAEQEIARLIDDLRHRPTRASYRALSPYQVNLFDADHRALKGTITDDDPPGVDVCFAPYDVNLGLVPSGAMTIPPV